jgi:hypothetical protein
VPRLLLVTPLARLGMVVAGDGVFVDEVDVVDVVVKEVIEEGVTTVMPKRRERERNQREKKAPRMPVRRGDGLLNQMADLTSEYEGTLHLRPFKARKRPSWTMDLLLHRSRTNKSFFSLVPPAACQTKKKKTDLGELRLKKERRYCNMAWLRTVNLA